MVSKPEIIRIREFAILLIVSTLILELFYQPNIGFMKSIGVFPAFKILGWTLLTSEFLIFTFIGIGILYVLENMRRSGRITFAPKIYSPLPELIGLFIFVSCIMGLTNPFFTNLFRQMLLPVIFYIVYINMNISLYWEKRFFKILILGLIGLTAISLMDYYEINFLSNFRKQYPINKYLGLWNVTILTVLAFNVAAARLLFSRFDFRWLSVLVLCFINFFFHIQYKNSIFALLISCILLFYFKVKISRHGLIKSLIIFCGVVACISVFFMSMPSPFKDRTAKVVAVRYFKVDDVSRAEDFFKCILYSNNRSDIMGDRIEVSKIFFKESLKGYGFAPYGFGFAAFESLQIDETVVIQSAHNLIVLFALNSGIIVALIMVLLIIRYIYLNMKILSNLNPGVYGQFTREDLIAMFCFSVSIIAESMFDITIRNIHVAWTFWFCVALLLKRWDILCGNVSPDLKKNRIIKLTKLIAPT